MEYQRHNMNMVIAHWFYTFFLQTSGLALCDRVMGSGSEFESHGYQTW